MDSKASNANNDARSMISYLPFFTLLSLGLGILSEIVYYKVFNLNVLYYLDVNEIILETVENLIKCFFFYFTGIIAAELFTFFRNRKLGIIDAEDERNNLKLTIRQANIVSIIFISIITFGFTILLLKTNSLFRPDHRSYRNYQMISNTINLVLKESNQTVSLLYATLCVAYIIGILLILLFFYFKNFYKVVFFKELNKMYHAAIVAGLLLIGQTITNSLYDAMETSMLSTYGTSIEIGTKKIVSNEKYYYIGRTRNFIFFHNSEFDFNDIYQNRDITKLSVKHIDYKDAVNDIFNHLDAQVDSINKKKVK